jgi:transcriptional regulator with XRE-family HTH domain
MEYSITLPIIVKSLFVKKSDYNSKRKILSEKLIEAREKAGLTQKQVAMTGVLSQTELSKLENGQRKVDFLVLTELASLYKRDISYFRP